MLRNISLAAFGAVAFAGLIASVRDVPHRIPRLPAIAALAAPVDTIHQPSSIDFAVQSTLPPIVGLRAHWCRSQDDCPRARDRR